LTPEDGHTARGPTWAPDGKHLAYTQGSLTQTSNLGNGTVYVSDAEGSNPRPVTTFDTGVAFVMDWSPDGSAIVVGHARSGSAGEFETIDTWIMGADGSDPRILVSGTIYTDEVWAPSSGRPASEVSPRQ
jgi:Tol biopolymer transport system component